jgi:hypothetical protein
MEHPYTIGRIFTFLLADGELTTASTDASGNPVSCALAFIN